MYSQAKYRILTSKGETIKAVKIDKVKSNYVITNLDGETLKIKKNRIIYINDILPNWEYFEYKYKDGLINKYIVVNIDSISKEKIYAITKNWIKDTYNNPDEVLKADFSNKKLRIEGYDSKGFRFFNPLAGSSFYGAKYSIEISFKDNKYKFSPLVISLETGLASANLTLGEHSKNVLYKKNGEAFSPYKYYPSNIEDIFNNLNISLYNYILKNIKSDLVNEDEDW